MYLTFFSSIVLMLSFFLLDGLIVAVLCVVSGKIVHYAIAAEHEKVVYHLVHEVAVVADDDDTSAEVI